MKTMIVILLFGVLFGGCSLVVREDAKLRTFGVKEENAQEVLRMTDKTPEEQKTKIWPRR